MLVERLDCVVLYGFFLFAYVCLIQPYVVLESKNITDDQISLYL